MPITDDVLNGPLFQVVLDFSVIDWLPHQSRKDIGCDAANHRRTWAGPRRYSQSEPLGDVRAAWEWENPLWTSLLSGITLNEFAINSFTYITASNSVSARSASRVVYFQSGRHA